MEEWIRSKFIEIEVGEKKYKLGYPNRLAVINAEKKGLNIASGNIVEISSMLFYTALASYNNEITLEEGLDIMDKWIDEGGDLEEITKFLSGEYQNFIKSPTSTKKKKTLKIMQE